MTWITVAASIVTQCLLLKECLLCAAELRKAGLRLPPGLALSARPAETPFLLSTEIALRVSTCGVRAVARLHLATHAATTGIGARQWLGTLCPLFKGGPCPQAGCGKLACEATQRV